MTVTLERPVSWSTPAEWREEHVPPHTCPPAPPVLLGWPVLVGCPAPRHNSLGAARLPHPNKCVCPRARALAKVHRDKDRAAAKLRNASKGKKSPEELRATRLANLAKARAATTKTSGRVQAELAAVVQAPAPQARSNGLDPECRVAALGGQLTISQAEDFYDETTGVSGHMARERAKAVCRRCPIQRECLERAVEQGEAFGVWGGLTPKERRSPQTVALELRQIRVEAA